MLEAAEDLRFEEAAALRDELHEVHRAALDERRPRRARSQPTGSLRPMADQIVVRGAREHNLKDVHLEIPRDRLVVFTGLSGSGKSSLAFDTIYAEGQRRYVESLSAYARQFLGQMDKPDVDFIEGLSPAISIDQKSASRNPRSTVGTVTEVYDYLRLLFARIGRPHCPSCGKEVGRQTPQQIVDQVLEPRRGRPGSSSSARSCAAARGSTTRCSTTSRRQGFSRVRVDGDVLELTDRATLDLARYEQHTIDVVVDRLVVRSGIRQRLTESVETALRLGGGSAAVAVLDEDGAPTSELLFSEQLACAECGISFDEPAPRDFSFNSPYGACPTCAGLGTRYEVDAELVVPDTSLSVADGALAPWAGARTGYFIGLLTGAAEHGKFSLDTPWRKLKEKDRKLLLYGNGGTPVQVRYKNRYGRVRSYEANYEGLVTWLERRHGEADSDWTREQIEAYMREVSCSACGGARLKPSSLAVTVLGRSIAAVCALSISEFVDFFSTIELTEREAIIGERVIKEILERAQFLVDVGLEYLSLSRSSATLSGGEAQRIRLASQIGSRLVGVLYVLDEPSIGLHQRDNQRLIGTLERLRNLGNTVIVVEHDEETIRAADHIVDIGPGAGEHGGAVVHSGPVEGPDGIEANEASITGDYLAGRRTVPVPALRRPREMGELVVLGARANNLRDLDVAVPLGCFVAVTGVSGSGKSTLVNEILLKSLLHTVNRAKELPGDHDEVKGAELVDKVVAVDQQPIGRTPRSNPATYTGVFDKIRTALRRDARGQGPRLPAGPLLVQRERWALRGVRGRRDDQDRDALPARRLRRVRGVRGRALQPRDPGGPLPGPLDRRGAGDARPRGAHVLRAPAVDRAAHPDAGRRGARLRPARPARADALGGRGAAREARDRARPTADGPHAVRPRRAHDGPALRGRPAAPGGAAAPRRAGQHRRRHRAQPRRHEVRRLDHRPRPRGGRGRRVDRRGGNARGGRRQP